MNTGVYLDKPVTIKETIVGSGRGDLAPLKFALSSMQGWRVTMEDAHAHMLPVPANSSIGFFGIFDGHGGDLAAKFAAKHVFTYVSNSEAYEGIDDNLDPNVLAEAIVEGFLDCDEDLKELPQCKSGEDFSGSTGSACLVTPTHLVAANTGDSRLCVCRDEKIIFASKDHKPEEAGEKDRIVRAGGEVIDNRVNGDLASARSFGDFRYKLDATLPPTEQQITVLPDVTILTRSPRDQFVLLACDGIWDVMSNLEATCFIRVALKMGLSLATACEMLLDECLRKNSADNMSIMVVGLDNLPEETGKNEGQINPTFDDIREAIVDTLI